MTWVVRMRQFVWRIVVAGGKIFHCVLMMLMLMLVVHVGSMFLMVLQSVLEFTSTIVWFLKIEKLNASSELCC